jgi:hypothetical protein
MTRLCDYLKKKEVVIVLKQYHDNIKTIQSINIDNINDSGEISSQECENGYCPIK